MQLPVDIRDCQNEYVERQVTLSIFRGCQEPHHDPLVRRSNPSVRYAVNMENFSP